MRSERTHVGDANAPTGNTPAFQRMALVVDFSHILVRTLTQALQQKGICASYATNARQALRMASSLPIDGAIIDLDLHGRISGMALCHALSELRPDLAVVLTSTSGEMEEEATATVLRKPCKVTDLLSALFPEVYE